MPEETIEDLIISTSSPEESIEDLIIERTSDVEKPSPVVEETVPAAGEKVAVTDLQSENGGSEPRNIEKELTRNYEQLQEVKQLLKQEDLPEGIKNVLIQEQKLLQQEELVLISEQQEPIKDTQVFSVIEEGKVTDIYQTPELQEQALKADEKAAMEREEAKVSYGLEKQKQEEALKAIDPLWKQSGFENPTEYYEYLNDAVQEEDMVWLKYVKPHLWAADKVGGLAETVVSIAKGGKNFFDAAFQSGEDLRMNIMGASDEDRKIYMKEMRDVAASMDKPFEDAINFTKDFQYESKYETIVDAIGAGDYTEAADMTIKGVFSSLPYLALSATGIGGIVAIGATTAGGKYDELIESDPDEAMSTILLNAGVTGLQEAALEVVSYGIIKRARGLIGRGEKEAADALISSYGNQMAKRFAVDASKEGVTEAIQEFNNDLIDYATLSESKERQVSFSEVINKNWKKWTSSGIVGFTSGGMINATSALNSDKISVRNAAETALTPESDLMAIRDAAININNLNDQLKETTDKDQQADIKLQMFKNEVEILGVKQKVTQELNNMTKKELTSYARNKSKLNQKRKWAKSAPSIFIRESSAQEIENLERENEALIRESVNRRIDENAKKGEKTATQVGANLKTVNDANTYQKAYNNTEQGKKESINVKSSDGFIDPNTGNIFINKEVAEKVRNVNTAGHEILHAILNNSFKEPGQLNNVVKEFKSVLPKNIADQIQQRIDTKYKFKTFESESQASKIYGPTEIKNTVQNDDGTVTIELVEDAYNEEYLTAFADIVQNNKAIYTQNENVFTQLGDFLKPIFRKKGYGTIKFNTGQDVYDFIESYQKQITKGELDPATVKAAKEGIGGKLVTDVKVETEAKPKTKKVEFSESIIDETPDKKKVRQDTRNVVFGDVYKKYAKGKTKEQWKKFVESPEGLALVQDEILAGTTILDKDNNILEYSTRAEKKALLQKSGNKEVQTSFIPDMIAIAIQKGSSDPTATAYAGIDFLMNHVKAFNPEKNNDLAGYIGGYLGLKVGSGFNKMQKKGDEISMEKEGVKEIVEKQETSQPTTSTTEKELPQFFIKDRLGDKAKAIDKKVKAMASTVDLKGKGYKQTPKLALKETVEMFMSDPKATYVDDGGSFWKTPKGKKALGTSIAESILNKIENNAALNGQDIKAVQQFLMKNRQTLISGALAEGTDPSGKSTGMAKVLLDKFYSKGGRVKAAKTGSTQGLSKQTKVENIDESVYNEMFGITSAGTPNVQNISTSSQPVKAMIRATEKILTNQALRQVKPEAAKMGEGRSRVMFSEDKFENETNWKTIPQKIGLDAIKTNTLKGKQEAIDILFFGDESLGLEPIVREFPKSFIIDNIGTFSNGGVNVSIKDSEGNKKQFSKNGKKIDLREYTLKDGTTIRNNNSKFDSKEIQLQIKPVGNFLFANKLQVLDAVNKTEKLANEKNVNAFAAEDSKVAKAIKRQSYKNLESDMKNSSFKEDQKEARQGFKGILSVFNELIQSNPQYAPAVVALMSSTSGGQGHFMRKGSIAEFFNILNTINVEEHTSPASDLAKFLVNRMVDGNFDEYVDAALDGYFQGSLPKVFDLMLKGDGFNYIKNIPKEYRFDVLTGVKSVWIRYFNPKVNAQVRYDKKTKKYYKGIDPNVIILSNGKSIAENFGLKVDSKFLNPEVISLQQKLLFEIFNGDITQEVAKQRLQKALPVEMSKNKTNKKVDIPLVNESRVVKASEDMSMEDVLNKAASLDEALRNARNPNAPVKKIRVFDFDDTLARTKSNVLYTMPDGITGKLTAEEFAQKGDEMLAEGAVWDFSEFNKVMDGKKGPLFEVAKKIQEARGADDIFVLTARAPEASPAIKEFLDAIGLNIPLKNISGLGNSSPFAKSNWIVDKAAEGYNDFYFADDHTANVKAVRDALEVLDVKSKTQQAKIKFSEDMSMDFNTILEESKGVDRFKIYSDVKAQLTGARKGRGKFFIPPSAEDFQGLLYATLGKGKQGIKHMQFYDKALLKPYAQAMENLATDRVNLMADFKALKKELDIPKDLQKATKSGFTNEQAVRVYLWAKTGQEIPGISKADFKELNDIVENDPKLKVFADQILSITKGDGYSKPGKNWTSGTITTDLVEILNTTKRTKYLETWQANADLIFSKDNMNKLESIFGPKYVEALRNSLSRMKAGRNRIEGGNRLSNRVLDYINNSTGAIMFFNMRSALLQTISAANFINWSFNNPLKAGKAFANQPQYWKDFKELMNSDYLVDRRNGLKLNINESEIADAAKTSKNKAKAVISYIIEKGYIPTKFADSFAIATGGATFYRNRINDLMKNEGKTEAEAKKQAMEEFRKTSEISQQSSDPSKISQQQSTDLGRVVLQFVNTPMQYARIQKRAFQDIANGRGDNKTNVSKIIYYGFLQNMIFNALQSGLFAIGFGDDDELSENDEKKIYRSANGMMDSWLRGLGFAGVTVQVLKNLGIDIYDRSKRDRPEYVDAWQKLLEFSPAIKSKLSKIKGAAYPFDSKKRRAEVFDKGFSLDNPAYESVAKVITATTNIPLDRLFTKVNNIKGALDEDQEAWKSTAMILGWPEWQLTDDSKSSTSKSTKRVKRKRVKRKRVKRK